MASAPIYCTHKELKRVFPQIDEYDQKTPLYGWIVASGHLYQSGDSGLVTALFVDGVELGSPETTTPSANGEWRYTATDNTCYYYNDTTNPNDLLIEAGEDFDTMITQFRTDASRYLDSRLDPKLPKSQWKNSAGEFDYIIVRTTALIAACFMIRTKDPASDLLESIEAEFEKNIDLLNTGRASIGFQNTGDASRGVIRDVTYTSGKLRPVDTKGDAMHVDFDLIKVKITTAGAFGTGKYSVWVKDENMLKNNKVVDNEIITGDYQPLAYSLQIRFGGDADADEAAVNDEFEVEVRGINERTDASDITGIKMTRNRGV